MQLRTFIVALSVFQLGCSAAPSSPGAVSPVREHRLLVRPYLAPARLAQALVPTKSVDDIYYLGIMPLYDPGDGQYHTISKLTGEPLETFESVAWTWSQVVYNELKMPWIGYDRPIEIRGLKANGRYRLQALAWDRNGVLLSRPNTSSAVDLTLGDDDAIRSDIPLPVQLDDTPFGAGFKLTLYPTGAVSRLKGVTVIIRHRGTGSTPDQEVARIPLTSWDLRDPLQVSHLNALSRYVIEIEPQVSGDGALPATQSFEVQVGQDDALPDRDVEFAIPAL